MYVFGGVGGYHCLFSVMLLNTWRHTKANSGLAHSLYKLQVFFFLNHACTRHVSGLSLIETRTTSDFFYGKCFVI